MINCRYCLANVLDDSHERSFFIKADGKALYFPHNISWDDFENATGITDVTNYTFTHSISNKLEASDLLENEEFALCHETDTRKRDYVDHKSRKAKGLRGHQCWYQNEVALDEENLRMSKEGEEQLRREVAETAYIYMSSIMVPYVIALDTLFRR